MSKRSGLTTQMNLTQCSFVSRRRSCIVATRQNRRSQHITFPYPIPISTFPRGITPRARRRVARIIVGGRQFSANNLGIIAGNGIRRQWAKNIGRGWICGCKTDLRASARPSDAPHAGTEGGGGVKEAHDGLRFAVAIGIA
jgi:hypothetical protein